MTHIRSIDLPEHTARSLLNLQAEINAIPSYGERVQSAPKRFAAENKVGNCTFDVVRRSLISMCHGASRCMYCEDSMSSEVEHFRPKAFYPELVFVWLNYLYCCGPCNRIKRSHFRVLVSGSGYVDLVRRPSDPAIEPQDGLPVLLDPRTDDPFRYLSLDLVDTFWFVPRPAAGTPEYARAEYTIKVLKLNEREYLPQARREAYVSYRARLAEYVTSRQTPQAVCLARAISRCCHPVVWAEMKAQSMLLPDLAVLFAAAPEAAAW